MDNKKFDKEYSTQYTPEMKYLLEQGIRYTFVKDINGVTTYKYTKTPELFKALEFFYSKKIDIWRLRKGDNNRKSIDQNSKAYI